MILFTADIHIKLNQKNVPKEWALNRYRLLFNEISRLEEQCDLVVLGGDIFDRMPTLDELTLYFTLVSERKVRTIITTGNHESTKKGKSFFTELKEVTERLNPLVEVVVDFIADEKDFYVVPYEFIKNKDTWDGLEAKPVFTHVRGAIPPHVKPEIPLEWLSKFPVVFAGDLHSHSNTQENIVYPGSPVTTSFHRSKVETGVILIGKDFSDWKWVKLDLPQLIKATVTSEEDMVPTDYDHTIYELEGSLKALSKVDNVELLAKKIVRKVSDSALVLDGMTIPEELTEYLLYILELEDTEVNKVIKVFNDSYKPE